MSELPAPPATRQLGSSGIAISPIAWGMWRFAGDDVDAAEARVRAALDVGIVGREKVELGTGGRDERLDVLVARRLDLSRTQSATLIANRAVTVNGQPEKASFRAEVGSEIVVTSPEPVAHPVLAEDIAISVVFEDEHMMVVDKAAGMVVHPGAGTGDDTLVHALLAHVGQ